MALDFTIADQVFNSLELAGKSFALNFASGAGLKYSEEALGLALALEGAIALIVALSAGGQVAFQRFVKAGVTAAFVGGLIANWATTVVPYPVAISDELVNIASAGQSPHGLGTSLADGFSQAIGSLSRTISPSQQPLPNSTAPGGSQSLWQSLQGWWDTNPVSSVFVGLADGLTASLLSLLAVVALVAAFATAWMSLVTADLLIYLGLCLGPILLALSVIGRLNQWQNNWLGFMLGSMFLKPVLAILIYLSLLILSIIQRIAAIHPTAETPQSLILVFVLMLTFCIFLLISRAPSITSQLVGGIADAAAGVPDQVQSTASAIKDRVMPSNKPPSTPPGGGGAGPSRSTPSLSAGGTAKALPGGAGAASVVKSAKKG